MTPVLTPPFGAEARRAIARALAEGALMAYPTETSYALGGNALEAALCARIQALKGRPAGKALLLLIGDEEAAGRLARDVHPAARALMARFWPGPLTLVFQASANLPPHLTDERGTVALRWSPQPVLRELLEIGRVPLIGTSANKSGEAPLLEATAVAETFGDALALVIDGGRAPGGPPSTIVDTTVIPFRILRPGALNKARIQAVLVETCVEAVPE
jgi:L-threonylcarbamoyladenylate synthase